MFKKPDLRIAARRVVAIPKAVAVPTAGSPTPAAGQLNICKLVLGGVKR